MGKTKRGKKANADAVHSTKSKAQANANPFANATATAMRKINPFEVHMNREKFHIAGRICKHDKGLPGVSRSKALKRRQETLGQEYMSKNKTNRFRDRRIGKHLTELTEDVMNARFLADKYAQMKESKTSRFNLNEDEILTHRGQTLEEIEQFHDERSDDEAVEDDDLAAEFTETAHFGGDVENTKDRKTAIEEMILEQKKRKVEIAKEKEEVHDLTEKLDANYKNIIGLMSKITNKEMKQKPVADDYDRLMREMIFEPRGEVSDKLISEEEMARREKERLEKLERERLERMMDDDELQSKRVPPHRSADALDDDYYEYEAVEEPQTLAYKFDVDKAKNGAQHSKDDETAAEQENFVDNESVASSNDDEEETESESESEDNLSDLKDTESEEEKDEKEGKADDSQNSSNSEAEEEIAREPSKTKSKETSSELPFTIDMPTSYKEFIQLMGNHKPEEKSILVERLIKCNHPKLDGVNREKIVKLFAFLLQYVNELFGDASQADIATNFKTLEKISPHLFDLVHLNPERMSETFLKVLQEKYATYRKHDKVFPTLDTLVFLKLVSNLYTTSDFRHPIVTPCYVFMQHILSKARVRTRQDIAMGLFLVTLVLEYSHLSRRFLPAALNFLLGIVFLSIPKRAVEIHKIVPPFTSTGYFSSLLTISQETSESKNLTEELLQSEDLVMTTISTEFKVRALNMCLKLVEEAITIVGENVGANYQADSFLDMLDRLPLEPYPEFVLQNYDKTKAALEIVAHKALTKIVPPAKRPPSIRFIEPRIVEVRDDKRRPQMSKEKEEKAKLIHKVKRETKGALREIRRDTQYLQKIRLQQQIQSDMERKEKVRRIYHEAAAQQGELNELDRLKKRKKF